MLSGLPAPVTFVFTIEKVTPKTDSDVLKFYLLPSVLCDMEWF